MSIAYSIDITKVRDDFPVLHQYVNGKPLIYFDNAATTQKPASVIDAITGYYQQDNANIHRGIHTLAERATQKFEDTRKTAQKFINAASEEEVIFTRGTTEGINLIAFSFGNAFVKEGDEILITGMEHHSNIVPWQMLCERKGAKLKVAPVLENGELDMAAYQALLSDKTRLVSVVYASNTLGTVNPVKDIITLAHEVGAKVMLDGAQAASHLDIDVQQLDCDFFAFSGHKIYGPTGIGILYGKKEILENIPPYMGGGEMIQDVSFEKTTYNSLPYKFEAGTPNIADAIALNNAMEYINATGKEVIRDHEDGVTAYASDALSSLKKVKLIGTAPHKISVQSFVVEGWHHFDLGMILDAKGIAVRTGHHCTQPLMNHFKIEGTVRASFGIYNTKEEVETFVSALDYIISK